MMTPHGLRSSYILFAFLLNVPLVAQAPAMPDPKDIAGIPLPVADVAAGTVTVRVIRGALSNNIPNQDVELFVDGAARQQKTGETGRVEFSGLRPGVRVKAVTVVGTERLESQEFSVPATGGVRLLLVATDPEAVKRADEDRRLAVGPAQTGAVVLGEQSRFVFELGDEALNVFNIIQILNTARTPVETAAPVVFDVAPNGGAATLLNGSSPRAAAEGRRVVVAGPFAPGTTVVQFAYSVPYSGPDLTIEQRMPAVLSQVTVMAQKVGDMQLSSPQIAQRREMSAQGDTYIVGQGPGVKAGEVVSFSFSGLPHAPLWPRNVALALAAGILGGGAWASIRPRRTVRVQEDRRSLETRRDRLFSELTAIERRHRAGDMDPAHHASRRRELITELESLYAALDH